MAAEVYPPCPTIEQRTRFEAIFMPQTRKKRERMYGDQKPPSAKERPGRFVHYTSAESALKIINTKRVWMRSVECMDDYREMHHGFEIFAKFFFEKCKGNAFTAALDSCAPGAATQALELFREWWNRDRNHTYISCISEHDETEDEHGRLSMWRAFGTGTARVAIVLRIPAFSLGLNAFKLTFSPVAYLTEQDVQSLIDRIIKNIEENCEFLRSMDRWLIVINAFFMLLTGVACLKHEGFREEREWRAIYTPTILPSPLMTASIETVRGVPQIVHKLPLDVTLEPSLGDLDLAVIFDRLIIGPSPYPSVMAEAFARALERIGVPDSRSRVFQSGIPLRT